MPVSSATSPSHRPSSDTDTITLPWLRIVGGGGTGRARVGVSISTDSPGTRPYVGTSPGSRSPESSE